MLHTCGAMGVYRTESPYQYAQFNDAVSIFNEIELDAIPVAILDGVLYIKGRHKMYKHLQDNPEQDIMSALVLREFLYQI